MVTEYKMIIIIKAMYVSLINSCLINIYIAKALFSDHKHSGIDIFFFIAFYLITQIFNSISYFAWLCGLQAKKCWFIKY